MLSPGKFSASLLACGVLIGARAHPAEAGLDTWPRYAHDPALTSRSSLRGNIDQPDALWSYSTAGRELLIEISPASKNHSLALTPQQSPPLKQPRRAKASRPLLDLDGTGILRPAEETYHERWAKILPEIKGLQRVAWSHTWTDQKVCRLQLFAYDRGFDQPRLVWQTEPPEDTIFQPLNIVSDIDGDGVQEICVAAHYRIMIFEGTTGRKETELRYHQSRPYGWFGLADLDLDGQPELITLADFQSHIDVLNYDPKKPEAERLSVRWRRDLEKNIEERSKWPQIGPRPVLDLTGDARPEIVFNLFNDSGDGQWHLLVLDAATGETIADRPRLFLQGSADLNGDGKSELFAIATDGPLVPAFGQIQLIALHGRVAEPIFSQENSAWGSADLPALDAKWTTTASQGMRHVLLSAQFTEKPAFLVLQRKASDQPPYLTSLTAFRTDDQAGFKRLWSVSGLPGEVRLLALDESSSTQAQPSVESVLRLRLPRDARLSLRIERAQAQPIENRPLGITPSTPIAARLHPAGPAAVIVEGAAEQIFALQAPPLGRKPPSRSSQEPRLLWSRPGRGMGDGSRWLGPLASNLDGRPGDEVVVASQDSLGRALLLAYRPNGSRLWQRCFEQTSGALPVWNVGALTFWWPGQFRAKNQTDLFVQTRRGLMHSDIGHLLDGRTGLTVWRHEKAAVAGQFSWGYAGIPPAIVDLDADGLDELISLYPVCFWTADGRTGKLKQGVELAGRKQLPAWAAYGEPIVHRFQNRQTSEILLDSPYILALLDTNGAALWHGLGRSDYPTATNQGNVGQTTATKHALIDCNGDGRFELASAGYGDGVRVIDPRDGKLLWSLPAPPATCPRVVAVDIDGRTGDELLYVSGSKLIAVTGDLSSGRLLWQWQGPDDLSMPAIADLDGDRLAEIIVQSADGTVHCLGQKR